MEKYIPVVVIKELSETDKILSALTRRTALTAPKLHSERRVRGKLLLRYCLPEISRNVDRRGSRLLTPSSAEPL